MIEWKTIRSWIYGALALFLFILVVHTLLQGVDAYLSQGNRNFPCAASYDERRDCIASSPLYDSKSSKDQIEVFLDAKWGGGSCIYQHTPSSSLKVDTPVMNLRLQRESDETVSVNGQHLEDDETFKVVDYFPGANPWIIFRLELTNYGIKAYCGSTSAHTILAGQYGTEVSAEKGWLIVLLLLIGLGIVIRQWFRL